MRLGEPTAALDPVMISEVRDAMVAPAQDDMTRMVTPAMGFANEVAQRVVFRDEGRIVGEAPTRRFFEHPQSERARAFLDSILH